MGRSLLNRWDDLTPGQKGALLTLASLRSPFVPDAYGMFGTLWLLTLLAAERPRTLLSLAGFGVAALAFSIVLDGGLVPEPAPTWMVASTLVVQLLATAFNVASIARPVVPAPGEVVARGALGVPRQH